LFSERKTKKGGRQRNLCKKIEGGRGGTTGKKGGCLERLILSQAAARLAGASMRKGARDTKSKRQKRRRGNQVPRPAERGEESTES